MAVFRGPRNQSDRFPRGQSGQEGAGSPFLSLIASVLGDLALGLLIASPHTHTFGDPLEIPPTSLAREEGFPSSDGWCLLLGTVPQM